MKLAPPKDRTLAAMELLGRRWVGAIVSEMLLAPAGTRFNHLLHAIEGISDRVLAQRLQELEETGVVERLVDSGPPVHVNYRLTERGLALDKVIEEVERWSAAT